MKKYIFVIILLIIILILVIINKHFSSHSAQDQVLLQLGYTDQDTKVIDNNIIDTIKEHMIPKTFFENIVRYDAYQEAYLSSYFSYYQQGCSIVECLNFVNHPSFLSTEEANLPAISPAGILLVNQRYELSDTYTPYNLVPLIGLAQVKRPGETMMINKEVYSAYQKLVQTIEAEGLELIIFSAYRNYQKQLQLWMDQSTPRSYLARPGHSEHQSGLALDLATLNTGLTIHFENTLEYQFLKEHAHEYGFIIRYPKEKEAITGYSYEPWHFRYVGIEVANVIHTENITLEEYLYHYQVIPVRKG